MQIGITWCILALSFAQVIFEQFLITFRNISKKLESNKGIEKFLVERAVDSLNGINDYDDLSKEDIDRLIVAFQSME